MCRGWERAARQRLALCLDYCLGLAPRTLAMDLKRQSRTRATGPAPPENEVLFWRPQGVRQDLGDGCWSCEKIGQQANARVKPTCAVQATAWQASSATPLP